MLQGSPKWCLVIADSDAIRTAASAAVAAIDSDRQAEARLVLSKAAADLEMAIAAGGPQELTTASRSLREMSQAKPKERSEVAAIALPLAQLDSVVRKECGI